MKKSKFNINEIENVSAEIKELYELNETLDELFSRITSLIELKKWEELTNHEINLTAYGLHHDVGKFITLFDVIRKKLLENGQILDEQVANYYDPNCEGKK
nr:MAG TPA: hypothetical protein [Caudoviricetes sp.]